MRHHYESTARARLEEVRKQLQNGAGLDEACRRTGERQDSYRNWESRRGERCAARIPSRFRSPRTR